MPMIRSGNRHGIDFLVLESFPNIFEFLWRLALRAFNCFCASFQNLGIDVTQGDVLGVVLQGENILDVRTALAMKSDCANADAIIGSKHLAGRHRAADDHSGCGPANKLPSW